MKTEMTNSDRKGLIHNIPYVMMLIYIINCSLSLAHNYRPFRPNIKFRHYGRKRV